MKSADFKATELRVTNELKARSESGDNEAAAVLLQHIRALREHEQHLAFQMKLAEADRLEDELDEEIDS